MKILFLAASPVDIGPMALDREVRAIQHAVEDRGIELATWWATEPLDLLRETRKEKPDVLHFSGHGGKDGLWMQDSSGKARLVPSEAVAETIAAAGGTIRLVVLNACWSDAHADAIVGQADLVIGMDGKVPDDAARAFARELYAGIAMGSSVAQAFAKASVVVSATCVPRMRAREGVDARDVYLQI